MGYVLVQQKTNWADEADFYGFKVMTDMEWEHLKASIEGAKYPFTEYVGSNQEVDFRSPRDILYTFKEVRAITDEDAFAILRMFGYSWQKDPANVEWGKWIIPDGIYGEEEE